MFFKWKIKIPIELEQIINKTIKIKEQGTEIKFSDRKDIDNFEDYDTIRKIKKIEFEKTFQELLFEFIDKSGLTDSQVYRKAFIDRRLFSKIRSDKYYHPSFGTITLLALALKLSTAEYEKLLNSASYSLSNNMISRVTLRYCFDNKIYNIIRVNNLVYTISEKEIKDL